METKPVTWGDMELVMRRRYLRLTGEERLGQAYFNELYAHYPEVANLVRGTPADPFYAESFKDPRFVRFFDTIIPYFS